MLKRLKVKNFKLLREVEIDFAKPLTVLIGPNAAGKSTVLEVLEFLRRCAVDGLQAAVRAHGGMSAIRTLGATGPVEIESEWRFGVGTDSTRPAHDLRWTIALDAGAVGARVHHERLSNAGVDKVITRDDGTRELALEVGVGAPAVISETGKLAFEVVRDKGRFESLWWLASILVRVRYIGVLATASSWARASEDRQSARDSVVLAPEPFLGPEGIGLANALYNLHADDAEAWNTLERAFRAEYPFVKRITFPVDPGGSRVSFAYEDTRFAGTKTYASQMSDGMIAFLSLLVSVLQPKQFGVLLFDEPDAHLHPSALRRVVSLCQVESSKRAIVLVTHSNALLDALSEPAKVIRIVEPGPTGAVVRSLDADALDAWRKDYSLSELRSTGMLDRDNTTYEAKP